jgi:hypothetical protein
VWRVDLATGASEEFELGGSLTNPAVGAGGNRLYAVEDGARLVRIALDGAGRPTAADRTPLAATLDPEAPRVAYDASASRMWVADANVVRQVNLATGLVEGSSGEVPIGRGVVLVAPDLLAGLPDGAGSVVFFDLSSGLPVAGAQAALPEAPSGGEPAVDAATRRVFVPLARSVVAAGADGSVATLDDGSSALHVSFSAPLARLAYPDLARFPGSVVVARGF